MIGDFVILAKTARAALGSSELAHGGREQPRSPTRGSTLHG
jgi:hypothetical protein